MENIIDKMNIPNLDKNHFLKYLDYMIFQDPLPEGYEAKEDYRELYKEVESIWIELFQQSINKNQ
jgi:hypothetical protein